jgi:hypothetical protein
MARGGNNSEGKRSRARAADAVDPASLAAALFKPKGGDPKPAARKAPAKRPTGRPSSYTEKLGLLICTRLADGESLRKICTDASMPSKTSVFRWLAAEKNEAFRNQYARARELQADSFVDDMIDIADDAANDTIETEAGERCNAEWISRSRVRIDTRKWIAARMAPKKYGDRLDLNHAGKDGGAITVEITRFSEASA